MTQTYEGPAADILAASDVQVTLALLQIKARHAQLEADIARNRKDYCFLCSSIGIVAGSPACDDNCPNHPEYKGASGQRPDSVA